MAKTIAALQVALDLESAAFVTQTDAAKRKAKELGDTLQATSETVQKSGNAAREAAGGFELATRQKSQMGDVARNAGYQIQDFAVQVGSGTSATQALTQQLPQLLSAFGAVGVVLGTVAAVTIPLLSAGFTALVGTMKSVEDAAKDVASAAAEFTAANNAAGQSLEEISEKYYANAAPALKALYTQLREIAQLQLGQQLKDFAGSLVNQFASVARLAIPEIFKPFLDSPAQKLGVEFGIAEQEAMRLLTTLRKFQSGEVNFESLRDQVLSLNLQQRQATESGRTQIQQLLKFLAQAQEALNQKTTSVIKAEGEAKKADDSANRRANSQAERLKREAQARVEAARRYIESLDQQIRKLREGEDAALRFEAAKFGPRASARAEDLIAARRAEEARKAAEKEAERAARDAQRERERVQKEAERAARDAERERERVQKEAERAAREAERERERLQKEEQRRLQEYHAFLGKFEAEQTQRRQAATDAETKRMADLAQARAQNVAAFIASVQAQIDVLTLGEEAARRAQAAMQGGALGAQMVDQLINLQKAQQAKRAAETFVEATRMQILALEMGEDAARRAQAFRLGPEAQATLEGLLRLEYVAKWRREVDGAKTAFERFEAKILDIDAAFEKGAITFEEWSRLIGKTSDELRVALEKPKNPLEDLMRLLDRTGERFTEVFVQMALTGKATFRDMVNSIAQDLLRLTVRQYITTPLFDFFKAALPTPAGKASGGPVDAGSAYIVGERGPELFVPAFRGTVVANDKLGGSTIVNNYNIQAIDVKSFEDRLLASNKTVFAANMYAQKSLSPQGRA